MTIRSFTSGFSSINAQGSNIRAITFDVGGTLIEPWPSVGHVYCEVAARHGYSNLLPADVNEHFARAWKCRVSFNHSRAAWAELVRQTFQGLIREPPDEVFFDALYRRFEHPEVWRVFDDVRPALGYLKEHGIKLGIISNWDERLRPLLRRFQLEHYFDAVIISCEIGATKPSPIIFTEALESLGLPAHSILHVGDSLEEDVRGAEQSGLRSILLNRRAHVETEGQIRSLLDSDWLISRGIASRK
jgi:putative hydrolase of the HAD superfamily